MTPSCVAESLGHLLIEVRLPDSRGGLERVDVGLHLGIRCVLQGINHILSS